MSSTYAGDVERLYVTYFGRPADGGGLRYWESVVEASHGNTAALAAAFGQSSEYAARQYSANPYVIVNDLYKQLFGHEADVPGLEYWGNALAQGREAFARIAGDIASSAQGKDLATLDAKVKVATEMTTMLDTPMGRPYFEGAAGFLEDDLRNITADHPTLDQSWFWTLHGTGNAIESLYVAYLGRPVDPNGLTYWEYAADLASGSTAGLAKALVQSAEYKQLTQSLNAYQIVNTMYNTMFGHDADVAGLNYWAQAVNAGQVKLEDLGGALVAGAQGVDLKTFTVKLMAAGSFTTAMNSAGGIETYQGDAGNAMGRIYLSSVTIENPYPPIDGGPGAVANPIHAPSTTLVGIASTDFDIVKIIS